MNFIKYGVFGYKCFVKETEFDAPQLVNLIIGKNNSGKSSFLDVIKDIYCSRELGDGVKKWFYCRIEEKDLGFVTCVYDPVNKQRVYVSSIPPMDKKELVGKTVRINVNKNVCYIDNSDAYHTDTRGNRFSIHFQHIDSLYDQLKGCKPVFIKAERDVASEPNSHPVIVHPDGSGLTSVLRKHFSNVQGSRKLIKSILDELNTILKGDEHFDNLRILEDENGNTIYLENKYGEISLNDMGSGIKTLLLVLYYLKKEEELPSNSIFMFEELENNLHPEIQRRLFNTIYSFAIKNKKQVFVTSHSHVAINCFYGKDSTCIYHIEKDEDMSSVIETVDSDLSKSTILEDLGVKASDLFQTNGIIWVEGPSDRIYINKWLKLVNPDLKEGIDYTFLLYGGKLLSHYTVQEENNMIDILLTNRNSAIVIDSDIKEEGGSINTTKKRISEGFEKMNKFCWITKGREIENYISEDVINEKYKKDDEAKYKRIGIYQDFKDYIAESDSDFERHKVQTAESLVFNNESLDILDLKEKVKELALAIKNWNK